ncbi:MAG TPA: hypothetical protein PLQ89_16125 [Phycisphaerae bacterium]|nr:hypothetical protein [Phycisphaerae bacterium]HOJ74735.1 hypothetical protein [Phycisphaerae bacterium]HOM52104.1 hypothetical protein [Phycisphaerae bacterium]HOQ87241.1 hypothetical protein [Phycisphaerae bacterium]HPP27631.1 hypothetical protein [Phycisphaerae bacterium]
MKTNLIIGGALAASVVGAVAFAAPGSDGSIHAVYLPDVAYPEFAPLWREGWPWTDENGDKVRYGHADMPLGGYLFAYFRNSTDRPLQVEDVFLQGVSLAKGVAPEGPYKGVRGDEKYPSSLRFSKLPAEQIEKLTVAGTPVWWKVEPMIIPPGGLAEVTIRLRRQPQVDEMTIGVPVGGKTVEMKLRSSQRQPRFYSISFSPELDAAYVYLRHPSGKGIAPTKLWLDGRDVTARSRIVADEKVDTVAATIVLDRPVPRGSFHVFRADYADGTVAMAGLGAWQLGFLYGMWGCDNGSGTPEDVGPRFLNDLHLHNINLHMSHCPGAANEFMHSEAGYAMLERLGIRRMLHWINDQHPAIFYFLTDEPDAADFASKMLPPEERLGSLAQWLVDRCHLFRRKDQAATPLLLNIDNTYKPENWYMYAQLPDIPCADPYYQEGVQSVWHCDPTNLGAYLKPTYVYAVGEIYQSAGAPNPMHLILHTCKFDFPPEETPYRGPTPEEKRVEVYYALAAGAKQISYWWYCQYDRYHGVGHEDMKPLWTEIGLLGAEARTVGDLVAIGCPARVPVESSKMVWCRSLLAGGDTMILLVVNDNLASDRLGTVYKPRLNTRVKVSPPAWIKTADVFEVSADGLLDVKHQPAGNGAVSLELGRLDLTRMVVLTADAGLRSRLQAEYDAKFAANVRKLKGKGLGTGD